MKVSIAYDSELLACRSALQLASTLVNADDPTAIEDYDMLDRLEGATQPLDSSIVPSWGGLMLN